MVRLVLIIFFVYTIILSIGSINCIDNNNLVTNQAALFVFGDSLFDAGNNNYINGRTVEPLSSFPPEDYPMDAWLPLIPPNLQPDNGNNQFTYGVSFASAGAGALAESFLGMVINLGTQLNNFKDVEKSLRSELGDAETKRVFSRAVYLFHIGANDYFYPFSANSSTFQSNSKEKFVDFVIGNTTFVIEEVYKMGGRKFGFLNVGPYECSPNSLIRDRTKIGSFSDVLRRLQRQLSGFRYALHDYHTSLSERINSPAKYGFKEGKKACCGSGPLRGINTCGNRIGPSQGYDLCENVTDYLFFDSSHLTEKAHRQIAELIWNGPPNVTRPYNLKALFELN
ncbi:GDSL esterase/lipase 3 [Arabidopsis thaliana]